MMWKQMLHKSKIYPIVLIVAMYVVFQYRQSNQPNNFSYSGVTMGVVPFSIVFTTEDEVDGQTIKKGVDSVLITFNKIFSTYDSTSDISIFNNGDSTVAIGSEMFYVLQKSKDIYQASDGTFDPTVKPLVNLWGFGSKKNKNTPDSTSVDSVRGFVGFDKVSFSERELSKTDFRIELDFSAIAKGYASDLVGKYLEERGIDSYRVEIGGEVVCKGNHPEEEGWPISIESPFNSFSREEFESFRLKNIAVATSGNYRNFKEVGDWKYGHTINPITGYPEMREVWSASVFAPECVDADAYATAFMVMGVEKAKAVLDNHDELGAYIIYQDENEELQVFVSDKVKKMLADE